MYGALILLIANVSVKLIGAFFKIPLTYVLGEEGMGYFGTAYQVYTFLFIVATAGLPVAISKMVAESKAQGRDLEAQKTLSVSFKLLMCIGVAGFCALFFGADFIAGKLLGNTGAAYGIRAIAPAMLFVSVMSAFRGYFQGHQNMIPTAASEIAEALGKLIIGFAAAYLLLGYGMEYASAGAILGVSCGGLLGAVILTVMYIRTDRKKVFDSTQQCESSRTILKKLVLIAIPITIGASVFSLTSLIDMSMIMHRLQAGGFSEAESNRLWGLYSGYAVPLFNMPPTLINAITVSIVPAIASAYSANNRQEASQIVCKSMKITILFTLACSVGMSLEAGPILHLLYNNTNATLMLSILSLAIVFVSLVLVTNAVLQATGNANIPVINMIIGGVIKVITNYFLVANPAVNINGAPIGTTLCYITILVLNIIAIKRKMTVKLPASELIFKPMVAVVAMAAVLIATNGIFSHLGRILAPVASIGLGALVYLAVIVVINGISEEDIELLPKSDKLIPLLKKFRIIR